MTYHINAIGIPKAQPRIKAYLRGAHAGVYTPDTADDWKRSVMIAAHELAAWIKKALPYMKFARACVGAGLISTNKAYDEKELDALIKEATE